MSACVLTEYFIDWALYRSINFTHWKNPVLLRIAELFTLLRKTQHYLKRCSHKFINNLRCNKVRFCPAQINSALARFLGMYNRHQKSRKVINCGFVSVMPYV